MGYMVDDIKCPKCGNEDAEDCLHDSLDFKYIKCPKCGYYQEYEREWTPWKEKINENNN